MTAHFRSPRELEEFVARRWPDLATAPLGAIAAATIRGRSALGRGILAERARRGDGADALCELARAIALRPVASGDLDLALELYDEARASLGADMAESHRGLHLGLAVAQGDRARVARLRAEADRLPDGLAAAVDAELAHPDRAADQPAAASRGGEAAFLAAFTRYAGWGEVVLDSEPGVPLLDRLRSTAPRGSASGPLISVVMTCHRPGPELLTAVGSVVDQTWRDWELIIVDDASGAEHEKVLREAEELDERVRVLVQSVNGGTYRARNRAVDEARGVFVTGLDSDDWAHPRWLEAQSAPLRESEQLIMAVSRGVRATADLRLFSAPGRSIAAVSSTSIMYRARQVREKIGYYDVARKGADTEFRLRIQKTFGARRWIRMDDKHTVIRLHPASLSASEVGEGWMHPARAAYEAGFHHWHKAIQQRRAKPYLAPSVPTRPFPAPRSILGDSPRTSAAERVYVADWRYDTPVQRAALEALAGDAANGVTVALAHYQGWNAIENKYLPMAPAPVALAADLSVEWVDLAEVKAGTVVAADPEVAAAVAIDFAIEADALAVLPPPPEEPEASPSPPNPADRLRSLAGRGARLPLRAARRLLRGKRAALRRLLGRGRRLAKRALRAPDAQRLTDAQTAQLELWSTRLYEGWSAEAIAHLSGLAADERESPEHRLAATAILADWYEVDDRVPRRDLEFDVVVVSNFMLPGGSSSSSAEEVRAFRRAGLKVGLLHHPVYDWPLDRPVNGKIRELLDDDGVVWITAHDRVECDLAIVRFPRIMMRPMEDLPRLTAGRTILVVNQPPYEYYGPGEGRRLTWDVRTVHRNLEGWLGAHTWYPQGPVVRRLLETEHAAETDGIAIADDYWYGILDVEEWRRDGRRAEAGPIRIGRHARDHVRKWPEDPDDLLACYPSSEDFEIHVLGGARTAKRLLRRLPDNWTVHPFGSMPPKAFLHGLDAVVFFIAESGDEAFGRTPLEAMAVGLPCLLPRSFEPLYGDGAVYCEPSEVEARVREFMDEPDLYAEQSARAIAKVERDFSHQALLRRAAALGVAVPVEVRR
ncbi:glycosyltransferase [Glycomyces sp. TRM65418]|uniref:glycosyltransferase n=1 Tax=Glycomyces sp. TRM65418 TaxID=2867006 RepID=UPI001CE56E90|nr:glycosyltransferase [Glycomyces sp. TRM65418]MCC3762511.1 glycosyltransferase [Glycomyces sp. TRM65418]QZD56554.1 glycosyltransferase [Glycomyces sp. TRM65418]